MAFGRLAIGGRATPLFGLPGNPVAVIVVFHALVRDALVALAGGEPEPVPGLVALCDTPLAKVVGRAEFVRGVASRQADGWHVRASHDQGSGQLHSMTTANCLIVLEAAHGPVSRGDDVEVWPFRGLF
jgi:molybdopterin molybdotransferase